MIEQWAMVGDAAKDVGVRETLVRTWISRHVIGSRRIAGRVHVDLHEVRRAELDLRESGRRPGRRRRVA